MWIFRRISMLLAVFFITALSAMASSPLAGWWRGEVAMLPLVIHIEQDTSGAFTGALYSPAQTDRDIPFDRVEVRGDSLSLRVSAIGFRYDGVLDAGKIRGRMIQGVELPLTFTPATQDDATLYRPQTPRPPYLYDVSEVGFDNDSLHFAATLTVPWTGCFGAVVLVSGSGAQNRDEEMLGHKPFAVIADMLTRMGWAVLRYDDRGVGGSSAGSTDDTTLDFATDAMAALRFLRSDKRFAGKPVGMLGHSEGGLIAVINAAEHPDSLDFIITLAGPAVKGSDLMVMQNRLVASVSGVELPDDEVSSIEKTFAAIDSITDTAELRAALDTLLHDGPSKARSIDVMTSPWYTAFVRTDPVPYLRRVRCPMLALNGTWDAQVDAGQNLGSVRDNVPSAEVVALDGLNHMFQEAPSRAGSMNYGGITQTISPVVLDRIGDFLTGVVKKRNAR